MYLIFISQGGLSRKLKGLSHLEGMVTPQFLKAVELLSLEVKVKMMFVKTYMPWTHLK